MNYGEIKTHSENKYAVKEAEQSISGLEKQLEELQRFNRDSFIDFENLGIDFLFVDEAHHFKKYSSHYWSWECSRDYQYNL